MNSSRNPGAVEADGQARSEADADVEDDDVGDATADADADGDGDMATADASTLLAELEGVTYGSPAEKVAACTRQLRDAYPQGAHAGLGVKDGIGDDAGVAVTVTDDGRFVAVKHTYKTVVPERLAAVVAATDCEVVGTDTSYQDVLETTENAVWIAPSEYANDVDATELDERFGDWATEDALDAYPEWTYAQASTDLQRGAAKTAVVLAAYLATGYPVLADWVTAEPLRTVLQGGSFVCMAVLAIAPVFWLVLPGLRTYRAWAERGAA